jgi:DNA-binding response OmpR family regulator
MTMFQILIAEDDAQLRQMFCRVLQRSGFTPIPAADGQEALEILEREVVDLIVSDIMMPRVDGYELVQALRESGIQIPVLMITAKDRFQDMQMGFLSGTDDFMVKPVNVNEMVLRINALLRRAKMISERRQSLGGTVLEFDGFTLRCRDGVQMLPQKEFQLLYKLASYPGRIFTRQQLMEDIWGPDSESDVHTVDVHVGRLRERLRDNPDLEIVTVRGLGYKVVRKNG